MPSKTPRGPVELPEELLQHIFSFLHETGDLRDLDEDRDARLGLYTLVNVALTNKAYNRVVRPELYHTLLVEDDPNAIRPLLLLMTLVNQADTGNLVREVYSGRWSLDPSNRDQRPPPTFGDILSRVLHDPARVAALSWPFDMTAVAQCPPHAVIARILPLMPRLRLLAFSVTGLVAHSLIMDALRHVSLPELSEVQVACEDLGPMDQFIELLQRPALRTFRAQGVQCEDESTTTLATSSLSPKLERVFFEESFLDAIGVARLLVSAPGVKILSIHWASGISGDSNIEFGAIGRALRDHGLKLEGLYLSTEDADVADNTLNPNSSLGDLKDLVLLRQLALPHYALCGQEDDGQIAERSRDYLTKILPRSLHSLEIRLPKNIEMIGMSEDGLYAEDQVHMGYKTLDLQLVELMRSQRHQELLRLIVHRYDEFTCLEDAEALGWSLLRDGETFTLRRRE
ncbi:hypothetical protein LTR17_005074 [Elasticomyces elasticus]|nr:hypothetical protein LTR17_005074 [Elasticomyces elasticus]